MAALSVAEQKVLEYVKKAPFPVSESDVGKAFAKTVPRATTFLAKLYKHGYISVERVEHHGTRKVPYFYCGDIANPQTTPTTEEAPQTTPTKGIPTTEQTTTPEEAPTTDQTTPTMEEAPTTTEEALQTTTMEEVPQTTPTNEAPTTKQTTDPASNYLATHPNAPQSHTDGANSASNTQGVQVTDEDLDNAYKDVLSGRRYAQMPLDILDGLREDLELEQLSPSQVCQIIFYVADALRGTVSPTPTAAELKDPAVRIYVAQWLRDRDTLTPDEYVAYMMQKQRHWKVRVGTKSVDVSNTPWAQHLLNQYEKKK